MSDTLQRLSDRELEVRLRELGRYVTLPVSDQLATRVRVALAAEGMGVAPGHGRWQPRHGRRVLLALAACLALVVLVIAVSPAARATVARLFSIRGVEITRVPPGTTVPAAVGGPLRLGSRTALAAAQQRVRFRITIPHYQTIAQPDEVYLGGPHGAQVALVYRARAGLPKAAGTGVGLLISEFRAGLDMMVLKKLVGMGTTMDSVQFGDVQGLWLSGAPHFFGYATGNGTDVVEPLRLAGNTLLWERGGVTYRLEGSVSESTALGIARSMR